MGSGCVCAAVLRSVDSPDFNFLVSRVSASRLTLDRMYRAGAFVKMNIGCLPAIGPDHGRRPREALTAGKFPTHAPKDR